MEKKRLSATVMYLTSLIMTLVGCQLPSMNVLQHFLCCFYYEDFRLRFYSSAPGRSLRCVTVDGPFVVRALVHPVRPKFCITVISESSLAVKYGAAYWLLLSVVRGLQSVYVFIFVADSLQKFILVIDVL